MVVRFLTVDGECRRHTVVPADEGVLRGVFPAGVHDLQLVESPLNHDAELLAHFDLHTVLQPGGRHVEVGYFTLECGHLGLWDLHVLYGFGYPQSCRKRFRWFGSPLILRLAEENTEFTAYIPQSGEHCTADGRPARCTLPPCCCRRPG